MRDNLAKRLWSGEVRETDGSYSAGNLSGGVRKDEGSRRGQVPSHIVTPFRGKPRPFNPFSLRRLADTEAVAAAIDHILADLESIDSLLGPRDQDNPVADEVVRVTQDHLDQLTPNDESREDVDEAMWRDLLEVGNAVAVKNFNIDGKRVEVNPLDPNTFTVDWDTNRKIQGFWQYPNTGQGFWGEPDLFEADEVIWETFGKETSRAMIYGHSPVEKLQRVINIIGGLMDSEERELEEGMPPGIVSLVGDWSDQDYNRFEDYWENNVKGEPHKVPLAKGEAKFEPFTATYKDLQILDRQRWYFKLVGAIFKVPVSENGLAIGEEMTRATDVSQRQRYKQKTISSMLSQRERTWNNDYVQAHFTEELEFSYEPGLDLMEKKELASMAATLVQNGIYNVNEAREMLGKDPEEWGEGPPPELESGRDDGGGMMGQSLEAENQDALDEGLSPMQETDIERQERQDRDFSKSQSGGCCSGDLTVSLDFDVESCIESVMAEQGVSREAAEDICWSQYQEHKAEKIYKEREMSIEDTPFRQSGDFQEMSFQPKEIKAMLEDISGLFGEKIQEILSDIKAEGDKWQPDGKVEKSVNDFMQLVEQDIDVDFSQELAEVISTHKARKVLEGKDSIESELAAAGLDVSDLDIGDFEDRIARRIERRTLEVADPISQRLESEVKDTLQEGWSEGMSITDIERSIEDLGAKWQGTDAERLARDQMGKAAKEGRMEFAKETAEEVGGWDKVWITNIDGRERDPHAAMDGETVPQEEPFVVDYSVGDGNGPSGVEEDYPGDSRWGIQCRCDYELVPRGVVEQAADWGASVSSRARDEVSKSFDQDVWKVLLRKELEVQRGSLSRNQAWKDMDLGSKATYYKWIEAAGLKDSL